MTNLQKIRLAKFVDFVPKVQFGETNNLLDVLMKCGILENRGLAI